MYILGIMSGTSLDGLDIAYCDIQDNGFELLAAETYPYSETWTKCLSSLENASAYEYAVIDMKLGHYIGQAVNLFRSDHPGPVDLIASHGHTIFHQPHLGLTTQIGDGDAIAAETELPVVFNFRKLDVALGGQGAPLVPIGDRLLFSRYGACLNLGGIANISYELNTPKPVREAYDICPCNMALNHLARLEGKAYDKDGILARSGKVLPDLLDKMDDLDYYRQPLPKSLGKEWFVENFLPLINSQERSRRDLLCTTVEHIASQIANAVKGHSVANMLVTGGGAKNRYLIARLQAMLPACKITVPSDLIIDYKEAIIFALLGYLRVQHRANCLSSVTGAYMDNCGGDIAGEFHVRD
ncbi:MAG: anhydro-N-acetylmuramic acid kinase [Bacteroidales bacterium]|nr:anhydro-N-acetylmuramic acid kinase [Bacteroidales bacterium]